MKTVFSLLGILLFVNNVVSQQIITDSIQHDGIYRTYNLYIPASYSGAEQVPLVLNLHGYGSNNVEQGAYGDFSSIADTAGFIVALPQGTRDGNAVTYWNAEWGGTVDDIGFFDVFLDTLIAEYNIDERRIFSTGMSNGGFMSITLACVMSDRIASVASVTGTMASSQGSTCNPSRAVPMMQIHGTADFTVPYIGNSEFLSVDNVINHWVLRNNCDGSPIYTSIPDIVTTDFCTAEKFEYLNGDNGSEVVHYKITGGGHTWPGTAFTNFGITNLDFDASTVIWEFFLRHPMPVDTTISSVRALGSNPKQFQLRSSNPVGDKLSIEWLGNKRGQITIIDQLGRLVVSKEVYPGIQDIQLKTLPSGVYFIRSSNQMLKLVVSVD